MVRKFMRYVVRINRPRGTVVRKFMSYVAYSSQDKQTTWHHAWHSGQEIHEVRSV
jgi:hypothetical protein